ncbi:DUF362 domain-containing protein [bacterium]
MKKVLKKLFFPVLGFLSLAWFLIRVIPKPSRASYPCMKATFPVASSFVLYVVGLFSSLFVFKKARAYLYQSRYALFTGAMLLGIVLALATHINTDKRVYALTETTPDGPNNPMGVGKGVNPGRVVWVHNPDATDENCKNGFNDYWYQDDNTDQTVVNSMVSNAIQTLTSSKSDAAAWDALFRYYNKNHGNGDVGYTAGEQIVVKINFNGVSNGPQNINTSPQITYTILDHLVNIVGVNQEDIHIGDPNITFDAPHWEKCESVFPDVIYWGKSGGRTPVVKSAKKVVFTSDGGIEDWLPQSYLDAAYMINIPVFKKHHRGGISITSKLHFGSFTPFNGSAFHWHYSMPCPDGGGDVSNGEYGVYRCFVDIMGHKDLGDKTILNLVDGLWSSINWGHPPIQWRMAPFNNDWPNSIFASQDPVALQSVCFDFLFHEFDTDHPTEGEWDRRDVHGPFPRYAASDDFLHQAADQANWAEGIIYDPENDGTPLPASMGVHEHWNNADEKKYSQIDLVYSTNATAVKNHYETLGNYMLVQNYPNPFNPSTHITYELPLAAQVTLIVYNAMGQKIRTLMDDYQNAGQYTQNWDGQTEEGLQASSGIYLCKIIAQNHDGVFRKTHKMILNR